MWILPDSFWLYLGKKLPKMPHPFNKSGNGAMNLNYSSWEYESIKNANSFKIFETHLGSLKDIIKGKKIAELACGGGGKSVYLAEIGATEVKGCDLSENFINQAKNFAGKKNVQNTCEFSVNDATKTNYKDNYFDIVILASILEHVNSPEALLREAIRICKPKGKILFNYEGYYHWLGHHLWDALPIPWLHLFTGDRQRIRLYKKAVTHYPDSRERIEFRIGKNEEGKENFDYLNKTTLKKIEKLLAGLKSEKNITNLIYETKTFRKKPFSWFGKMPILREIFHESAHGIIEK